MPLKLTTNVTVELIKTRIQSFPICNYYNSSDPCVATHLHLGSGLTSIFIDISLGHTYFSISQGHIPVAHLSILHV